MSSRICPCAPGDLGHEVARMRIHHSTTVPPQETPATALPSAHSIIRPPVCCPTCGTVRVRVSLTAPDVSDDPVAIAPYDVEVFADLVCTDPARAAAQLAALSASAQMRQALAYVAWLAQYGIPISVDAVLAAWSVLLSEHIPSDTCDSPSHT